jgi:iron(III) transport system permease protein
MAVDEAHLTGPPARVPRPGRVAGRTRSLAVEPFSVVLFCVLLVVLVALVVPPIFSLVRIAFTDSATGQFSFENFGSILPRLLRADLLSNTFVFALSATAVSFVFGSLLAWFAERTNAPFRRLVYISAFTSFAFPTVIQVLGWIFLLGPRNGAVNTLLVDQLGLLSQPFNVQSMAGMVLVESVLWTPIVFLLMVVPFRSMDATLEEAGRVAGASSPQVFSRVTMRLAVPAGLAVLLITVVRNLEAFEVPAMLGLPGRVNVLTTEIFTRLKATVVPDYGEVSAYSTILILLVLPLLYGYYRATKGQGKYATVTGKGMKTKRADLGRHRWLAGAFMLSLPALVLAPIVVLFWGSLLPFYESPSTGALASVSLDNYRELFEPASQVMPTMLNTAIVAMACATFVVLLTAAAAWLIVRTRVPGRAALDFISVVPLAVPGIVLGVGVLWAYVGFPLPVYGTVAILVVAYLVRSIPYTMRFNHAGILGISEELEESALVAGATHRVMFQRILVPLLLPALFSGWVYAFLMTARELPVALLLQSSGNRMVSVTIWNLWEIGQVTRAAALSVMVAVLLTGLGWILQSVSDRFGVATHQ